MISPEAVFAFTDASATPTRIWPQAACTSTSPAAWSIRTRPEAECTLVARADPIVMSPLAQCTSASPSIVSRLTSPEAVCTTAVAYRPVAMTRADAAREDSDEPVGTVTVISIRLRRRLKPAIRSGISTVSRLPSSRTVVFAARSRAASSSGITSTVLVPVSAAVTVTVPDAARMRRSTGWGVSNV